MKTEIKAAECRETEMKNRMEEFTDERISLRRIIKMIKR